jgi:hypothetical protein
MENRWLERATDINVIQRAPNHGEAKETNYIRAGWTSSRLASERAHTQIAQSPATGEIQRSLVRLSKLGPSEAA